MLYNEAEEDCYFYEDSFTSPSKILDDIFLKMQHRIIYLEKENKKLMDEKIELLNQGIALTFQNSAKTLYMALNGCFDKPLNERDAKAMGYDTTESLKEK